MKRLLLFLLLPAPLAAQEIRAGTVLYLAERTTSFNGVVGTGSASMLGLEVGARFKYFGLHARAWGGEFDGDTNRTGAGKVNVGEIRLEGGPRLIGATVAYGRRTLDGAITARSWSFVRVGIASHYDFGGSGFTGELDAGYYTGVGGNGTFDQGSGADIETRLVWQPRRLPFYVLAGYRRERFVVSEGDNKRPDVLSSVLLGTGISLGRR